MQKKQLVQIFGSKFEPWAEHLSYNIMIKIYLTFSEGSEKR